MINCLNLMTELFNHKSGSQTTFLCRKGSGIIQYFEYLVLALRWQ